VCSCTLECIRDIGNDFGSIRTGDTDGGMIYVLNGCKNLKKLEIWGSLFGDILLLAGMDRYEVIGSLLMFSCKITLGACMSLATSMLNLNVEVMKSVCSHMKRIRAGSSCLKQGKSDSLIW
jgi:hypothetical protein